jgi:hypothetical protein
MRAEDDPRTLSPEMDEWKKRQMQKQHEAACARFAAKLAAHAKKKHSQ